MPDYPKLAQLWWAGRSADASSGAKTRPGSHGLALRRAGKGAAAPGTCRRSRADIVRSSPKSSDLEYWNAEAVKAGNLAPQLKIENEKEKPTTVNYDELVKSWQTN